MIKQEIIIGKNKWKVVILYTPLRGDLGEVVKMLSRLNCPKKDVVKIKKIIKYNPIAGRIDPVPICCLNSFSDNVLTFDMFVITCNRSIIE